MIEQLVGMGMGESAAAGMVRKIAARIQFVAVAASLFGILLGKYLIFLSGYNDFIAEFTGPGSELAAEFADQPERLPQLSELTFLSGIGTFVGEYGLTLGLFDMLWIFLAISTAWGMTKPDS